MKRGKLIAFVMLTALLCVLMSGALQAGGSDLYNYLRLFNEVLKKVQDSYVDPDAVSAEKLMVGAIKGMLAALNDPYTRLMPPENYEEIKEDSAGEFGGLGIVVTQRDGWVTIVSPMAGTPAFKLGLRPGDKIVAIGEESTEKMELNDAVKKMRGRPGTTVAITIRRAGAEDFEVTIERAVIKYRTVESQDLGEGIGYLRLNQFNEHADDDMLTALRELTAAGQLKGLIFDLRNNPGGLYDEAGLVADVFLKSGLVVYTQGRDGVRRREINARDDGTEPPVPLVVLINKGSASASEIVTGALKDNHRAAIVGDTSFGKGVVQSVTNLSMGYGLAITTERYYTPSGVCIDKQGIAPHYPVAAAEIGDTYVRALGKLTMSDTFIAFVNQCDGYSAATFAKLRELVGREELELPDDLLHWVFMNQLAIKDGKAYVGDLASDAQLKYAYDLLRGTIPDTAAVVVHP